MAIDVKELAQELSPMLEAKVAQAVEEQEKALIEKWGLDKPVNRFVPAGATMTSPEDRILADGKGGFKGFSHFAYDLFKAGRFGNNCSEELTRWGNACKTAGHMEEGDAAQGGYPIPEEFRAQLIQVALEKAFVRARANIIPMQTNRIRIPAVKDSDHSTNFFGGVVIYRPGEAEQKTASKPSLGQIALQLHKLTGLVYASDEIMEDSPISLEPLLTSMFGQAIAFVEDDDYLNGTGANMALGAFNAGNPSLVVQAKKAGQAANTILAENITEMWSRLHPMCMANAVWIANTVSSAFWDAYGAASHPY